MPQNPLAATIAKNTSNAQTTLLTDPDGNLRVALNGGGQSHLNITAATVVKATPGTILNINVVVAGSTSGTVNDVATTGGVAAANEIASIPNTVGTLTLANWPCQVGIVVTPGTGQTVAISYT